MPAQVQRRLRRAKAPLSYVLTPSSTRSTRLAAAAAADAAGDGSGEQAYQASSAAQSWPHVEDESLGANILQDLEQPNSNGQTLFGGDEEQFLA